MMADSILKSVRSTGMIYDHTDSLGRGGKWMWRGAGGTIF